MWYLIHNNHLLMPFYYKYAVWEHALMLARVIRLSNWVSAILRRQTQIIFRKFAKRWNRLVGGESNADRNFEYLRYARTIMRDADLIRLSHRSTQHRARLNSVRRGIRQLPGFARSKKPIKHRETAVCTFRR